MIGPNCFKQNRLGFVVNKFWIKHFLGSTVRWKYFFGSFFVLLERCLSLSFPLVRFLSFFLINVLKIYRREIFLVFSFLLLLLLCFTSSNNHFTNITITEFEKNFFVKDKELSTECWHLVGMLWRRTFGNESEASKYRRPER